MASESKHPTVEDYFSDDSTHGNEGIEYHPPSIPVSRRAPSPTSQPSDLRSDSGYATTAADLREDSYTHATYRWRQNVVHNRISSTEEYPREEKGNSQRRPREVIAKPAQLPKQRLPTIVHPESVPVVILESRRRRPRETVYHTEPSRGIAGRRSIPAALSSPYITQGARDMSISRPSIRRGSYPGHLEIEINTRRSRDMQSSAEYRHQIRWAESRQKVDTENLPKADDASNKTYADQSYRDARSGMQKTSSYTGSPSEIEAPLHETDENQSQYAEDDDEFFQNVASAPTTLNFDGNMEDRQFQRFPADEAGMTDFIITGRDTGKSYLSDNSLRQTLYARKKSGRDDQQAGTPNQSQMIVTQHDGETDDDSEIDDDISHSKTVARKTGAHRKGSVIDPQSEAQDHTDGITERHILKNEVENIEKDWKDVWNMIPEVWKWDLEYHTIHRADGTRHGCWTCTPLESDEPKLYPLTIASAPVVLPVEHQWPPAAGLNPPPDPRPSTPIDCSKELPLDIVRDLFLTFESSVGFYVLISGLIQVIVPDDLNLVRENQFSPSIVLKRSSVLKCTEKRLNLNVPSSDYRLYS
jgi:hypothetical protein